MQGKYKKGMERMKTKAVRIHGKMDLRLEEIELPNQEYLADNLKSIQNFAETNTDLPVRMMLVPDAAGILGAKLPAMAEVENQTQLISMVKKELGSSVEWIDAAAALNKHRNEKIYYKTDHHWTSLGAFYAPAGAGKWQRHPRGVPLLYIRPVPGSETPGEYLFNAAFWRCRPDR